MVPSHKSQAKKPFLVILYIQENAFYGREMRFSDKKYCFMMFYVWKMPFSVKTFFSAKHALSKKNKI